jgi:septum formation protein
MLSAAGVVAQALPADVDEAAVKRDMMSAGPEAVAVALARAKARVVSARMPGALVIGADQMLECDGRWFDKPVDRSAARRQLLELRGRQHRLICAVAVVLDGDVLWECRDEARLAVRDFSDAFLETYLDAAGPAVQASVGAYQLEGLGAQLFDSVDGDFFTILGLPLLPLLAFLRREGNLTP